MSYIATEVTPTATNTTATNITATNDVPEQTSKGD